MGYLAWAVRVGFGRVRCAPPAPLPPRGWLVKDPEAKDGVENHQTVPASVAGSRAPFNGLRISSGRPSAPVNGDGVTGHDQGDMIRVLITIFLPVTFGQMTLLERSRC